WRTALAGAPEELPLPTDRPRPAEPSGRAATVSARIGGTTAANLRTGAQRHSTTPFMVVHAAPAALPGRLSGPADVGVGTPVAGRGEPVLDDMIGMFVNTLALRTRPESGRTFADLLAQTRAVDTSAFAHATVPFEQVVAELGIETEQNRNPLFSVA